MAREEVKNNENWESYPDYDFVNIETGSSCINGSYDLVYGSGATARLHNTGRMPWLSDDYYRKMDSWLDD